METLATGSSASERRRPESEASDEERPDMARPPRPPPASEGGEARERPPPPEALPGVAPEAPPSRPLGRGGVAPSPPPSPSPFSERGELVPLEARLRASQNASPSMMTCPTSICKLGRSSPEGPVCPRPPLPPGSYTVCCQGGGGGGGEREGGSTEARGVGAGE